MMKTRPPLITLCAALAGLAACGDAPASGEATETGERPQAATGVRPGEDVVGNITATINGQTLTWNTVRVTLHGETTSTAEFRDGGSINLYGNARGQGQFSIEATVDPTSGRIWLAEVSHYPDGMAQPYWSTVDGTEPAIVFETLNRDGAIGRAEGRFSARLCRTVRYEGPDRNDCRDVSGTFASDLLKAA